ncbi:kinase-like protein [Ascodesmis nigricans]|uniref:Kinase-like protein n=1 Tax=Ascodesmis nigricans TaxID=341454 RepID=A0A4S2MZS7_9PEZI|nr:kinase-like protein [Ascodesmis nigricans]
MGVWVDGERCVNCPSFANCTKPTLRASRLLHSRFKLLKRCSTVWTATDTKSTSSLIVAVKIPACIASYSDEPMMARLEAGKKLTAHVARKYVLFPLEAFTRKDGRRCSVMSVMHGTLEDVRKTLAAKEVQNVAAQLFLGLDYMHSACAVLHIKPDNVLFLSTNKGVRVKFADFSCWDQKRRHRTGILPIDFWATGIMLLELWSQTNVLGGYRKWNEQKGKHSFDFDLLYQRQKTLNARKAFDMNARKEVKDLVVRHQAVKLRDTLRRMLLVDPKRRVDSRQLFSSVVPPELAKWKK